MATEATIPSPEGSNTLNAQGKQEPTKPRSIALIRRTLAMSRPYWRVILGVFALGALVAFFRYLRAYLFKPLMDDVLIPKATQDISFESLEPVILEIAILLGMTLVIQPLAVLGRAYGTHWSVSSVRRDIDQMVAGRFLGAPLRAHRQESTGSYLSRALVDAQLTCKSIGVIYNEIVPNLQLVIGGLIALFLASWQLALLSVTSIPPFMLLLSFFGRRVQKQAHRRQESQGDLSGRLMAILSGIKVIKAFQGQTLEETAFATETGRYFKRHMKVVWNGVLAKASGEFVNPVIACLVLGAGLYMLLNDMWGITIGTLTQFAMILITVYKPLKALTQSFPRLMESLGGAVRLFEVLDMDQEVPDRPDAQPMAPVAEGIRFDNVHFDYGDGPVLQGIDLEVERGEVIAIVGRTGSGKSTLVDLVLRFHDPTRGRIEIDGVDLRDLQRNSFLDHVAVVTQEPFLFDDTIFENIRYGRRDATMDEVRAAAAAASAAEFIDQLPLGYDTPVGELGLRLSGGQRQRVTIARAILANPDILVFDEATSALDAKTERAVQHAIEALRGERTIFLVAHRLSTIRHADRIVVIDEGRIAEIGDHETLLKWPGIYRELIGGDGGASNKSGVDATEPETGETAPERAES